MADERETIIARIKTLIDPIVEDTGVELVDIELTGGQGRAILRILIDTPQRVTLDDCVRVNRALSAILDIEDPIPYPYTLEVSSPGLDRPFKSLRDYERALGQAVRIVTREIVEGNNVHVGRLQGCDDAGVTLQVGEQIRIIPLTIILRAQKEIVWE